MQVNIKRIDPTLPLPEYHSAGAAAFDLYCRETISIAPRSIARIPTNLIIEIPFEYALFVSSRSSTPAKKGLLVPHGLGIIDSDYCGENDEILFQVYNYTDTVVTVERGERLAQGTFVKIDRASWQEVPHMNPASRGGFGSTGSTV